MERRDLSLAEDEADDGARLVGAEGGKVDEQHLQERREGER